MKNMIKIDGKEYDLSTLPEDVRSQLNNVRACDGEIRRLNAQLAIVQTARAAYGRALTEALPKD